MMLKPSEIYFCQDSINNMFDKNCEHRFKSIGQTLDELCEGRISVYNIPTISVMYKNGKWYTGDNRRLWVFRQLERLGKCTTIPVRETSYIPINKFTTYNGGVSVEVRRSPGGRWYLRPTAKQPSTPSLQHISPASNYNSLPIHNTGIRRQPTGLFSTTADYGFSSIYRPSSAINKPIPQTNTVLIQLLSNLKTSDERSVKYIEPGKCRFLKESIPRNFDNGRSYESLKRQLLYGQISYREIPAVKAYEAYGSYYVSDGNRRLKAMQEASGDLDDNKIKVHVIGDEDDLLDELRKEEPDITAFEVMQKGETVSLES